MAFFVWVRVLLKEYAAEVLIKAIEKVQAGEVWLDRSTMGSLLREMTEGDSGEKDPEAAKIATLTNRERQVTSLIAEGLKTSKSEKDYLSLKPLLSIISVRYFPSSAFQIGSNW